MHHHHHHHSSSSSSRSRSNSRGHRKHRNRRFIVIPGQQPAYYQQPQGYYQQPTVYQSPPVYNTNQYGGQYGQQFGFTQPQGGMSYTPNMGMNMGMGVSSDQQLKNAIDTIYYKYDRDGSGNLD